MSQMMIQVPDELEHQLRIAADQSGLGLSEYVLPALKQLATPLCDGEPEEKSIWDRIDAIWSRVPAEDLEALPPDGPEAHDHYVYGSPKQS